MIKSQSMRTLKIWKVLLLAPLLMAFQCDEDELIEDDLAQTGLLGRWEIADESMGGISDLSVKCCRFIEFNPDDNPQDLNGSFLYEDETGFYDGVFSVDLSEETILIQRADRTPITYRYSLNNEQDYLMLTFTEEEVDFQQGWSRIY